ncbi:MAG: hypothetical protein JXR34_11900 [Bacteroidales bacterium]|nr:hypothetical protein [Bacteroidales bacterium]
MKNSYQHRATQLDLFFKQTSRPFHPEKINLHNFLKSIIKQRKMLIKKEESLKDAEQADEYISFITRHWNYYHYTKQQLVSFFLRHYYKFFYLATPSRQKHLQELQLFYSK